MVVWRKIRWEREGKRKESKANESNRDASSSVARSPSPLERRRKQERCVDQLVDTLSLHRCASLLTVRQDALDEAEVSYFDASFELRRVCFECASLREDDVTPRGRERSMFDDVEVPFVNAGKSMTWNPMEARSI